MTKYVCKTHEFRTDNPKAWAGHMGRYPHNRGKGDKSVRMTREEYDISLRGLSRMVSNMIKENKRLRLQLREANDSYRMLIRAVNKR